MKRCETISVLKMLNEMDTLLNRLWVVLISSSTVSRIGYRYFL